MTAFVTGGSGFVGGAVIRALIAEGEPVRALARSPVAKATVMELGAEPVVGDLIDRSTLADVMSGCDVVYHVAGVNRMCPRDPTELDASNIAGAVTAVRAAADARIGRLVLTSSSAAIGERSGTLGTEDSVHRGRFLSRYERSKYLGKGQARAAGRERGIEVVTVNPASVQGPGRRGSRGLPPGVPGPPARAPVRRRPRDPRARPRVPIARGHSRARAHLVPDARDADEPHGVGFPSVERPAVARRWEEPRMTQR